MLSYSSNAKVMAHPLAGPTLIAGLGLKSGENIENRGASGCCHARLVRLLGLSAGRGFSGVPILVLDAKVFERTVQSSSEFQAWLHSWSGLHPSLDILKIFRLVRRIDQSDNCQIVGLFLEVSF